MINKKQITHLDLPPAYDSLFSKLKKAKEESSNPLDYISKACGIMCGSGELNLTSNTKRLLLICSNNNFSSFNYSYFCHIRCSSDRHDSNRIAFCQFMSNKYENTHMAHSDRRIRRIIFGDQDCFQLLYYF